MSRLLLQNENMGAESFRILQKSLARRAALYQVDIADESDPTAYIKTDAFHNVSLPHSGKAAYLIRVRRNPAFDEGRYALYPGANEAELVASDDAALHAALGRFLTESRFDGNGTFSPPTSVIDFTPARRIRGMYFATHFGNFYQNAPLERVEEILEDLAAEGCNSVLVWYDMHHFADITDPASEALIARLRAIIGYANCIGMGGSLTMLANESFNTSPVALRASSAIQNGYFAKPEAHYGVELCPSVPGGMEEILRQRRLVLSRFADLKIDYICYWPYDQGGCTCAECAPWGVGGFLKILPAFQQLTAEMLAHTKIILSTWYFDRFVPGEWEGLYKKITAGELPGIEYILSFFFGGEMPAVLRENGVPEGIKFIDFPEISMYSCRPWGGFGANPLPRFWEITNRRSGHLYSGAFPYSEGIFEDVNKYITLHTTDGQFVHAEDAVRAYVKTYFCTGDESLTRAILDTEVALIRSARHDGTAQTYEICDKSLVRETYETFCHFDEHLPAPIRASARWRMLFIRAALDYELVTHEDHLLSSPRAQELLTELSTIYAVGANTSRGVKPPLGI